MPRISRFILAERSIRSFFDNGEKKVFQWRDLDESFQQKRSTWNFPPSSTTSKFIEQLLDKKILRRIELVTDAGSKERYITNNASVFEIAVSLQSKSYISHYSAMFLNNLTNQVPKTIFVTHELSKKHTSKNPLLQENIDNAFSKPQRESNTSVFYGDFKIIQLNGKYSNRIGVNISSTIPVTNIERTLIDVTVRPNYAGGVSSVLEAYKKAKDEISMNKLLAILNTLDFIYPYFQAIGFYLERAGVDEKKLEKLKSRKKEYDFYLTYEIEEKEYSPEWRIYYPKGI